MNFNLIQTIEDLSFLNKELLKKDYVGVDTEFRRTSKDNMKLCLLQINDSQEIYLIDCLKILDPTSSCSFLFSEEVKKIFHSSREDIQAIFSWTSTNLKNIFDTQLANAFLGGTLAVSYQDLVLEITGVLIEKDETRSNWIKRPLRDSQLRYAASDVQFLIEIFEFQENELRRSNKTHWFNEEIEHITKNSLQNEISKVSAPKKKLISKKEEEILLKDFTKIVKKISEVKIINPTLFFSKKNQKKLIMDILCHGLGKALKDIPDWKKNLFNEELLHLFKKLEN